MTLVLATAAPDIAFMVADTLLTSESKISGDVGPVSGMFHALKIHILDEGNIAVAFAGDFHLALGCIAELDHQLTDDVKLDPSSLIYSGLKQAVQRNPDQDADFLILNVRNGNTLSHVSIDGITQKRIAYIGDAREYSRLREIQMLYPYHSPTSQMVQQGDGSFQVMPFEESANEKSFQEVSLAMERLVEAKKSKTVGAICGCVIRVVDARISRKLEYLQTKESGVDPWEGQTGFEFFVSNAKKCGVAIFYQAGCLGFVMAAGDPMGCRKEYAQSAIEFKSLIYEKYGLELQ